MWAESQLIETDALISGNKLTRDKCVCLNKLALCPHAKSVQYESCDPTTSQRRSELWDMKQRLSEHMNQLFQYYKFSSKGLYLHTNSSSMSQDSLKTCFSKCLKDMS